MATTLLDHNPLLKKPLLKVLAISEQNPNAQRGEIERLAEDTAAELFTRQSATTIVEILLRHHALAETILVNGEVYKGSLQDIQTDGEVEDDAHVEQYLSLTASGQGLLHEYSGDKKLRELIAAKPHYESVFQSVLSACNSNEGCSLPELERIINAEPALTPNERGEKVIFPQFFIDSLETAGGIAWQDSWHTTEAGRMVMQ